MTDRASGRHRAPARATTPLSTIGLQLGSAVSDHVTGLGRTGVVLAMSSGLVATMGLPAGAVARQAPDAGALAASASTTSDPALMTVPATFVSGAPLSAPAGARVDFDRSSFTAAATTAKPAAPRAAVRAASRGAVRTDIPTGGAFGSARGSSIIAVAARYLGVPYVYGGTSPAGMDCSGYTQYVFAQLGIKIPRVADDQYQAATRVSSSNARPGDLVFFLSGGSAYHVGIYAGDGMMYDAGRPGEVIVKRKIWSANIAFGRF